MNKFYKHSEMIEATGVFRSISCLISAAIISILLFIDIASLVTSLELAVFIHVEAWRGLAFCVTVNLLTRYKFKE